MNDNTAYDQYFLSYSGARLPLNLVSQIAPEEVKNRNTYFGAMLDEQGRICLIHKRVYGEIELSHEYRFDANGVLESADIRNVDDERLVIIFDSDGNILDQREIPGD
ncbi:DUF6156 family protein [Haliea sp. E17]|uniref:DUF6156 family protein n=1 Tax=Haliea sp. E17 TaxID=3401576 RepID=UPI003AAD6107